MTKAMKKRIFVGLMWLCATAVGAQTSPDSLAVAEDSLAIAATEVPLLDTIPFVLVPASIDYIPADETPALLKDRLGCIEQIIPLTYNDKVHAFINYFTIRDREYTRMVQRRKNLYFPMFEKYLDKHQLPDELKYLSIIESGLNPRAISRARAVGLWQFMSGTGRYFGLRSDGYTDDRMDPEKSTEAACLYLNNCIHFLAIGNLRWPPITRDRVRFARLFADQDTKNLSGKYIPFCQEKPVRMCLSLLPSRMR
jgi:membrane-bound lytic murein transglycosylase D